MACTDQPIPLDDHPFALQLQLQEIETQRPGFSGKWAEGSSPDYILAYNKFENEVNKAILLIQDIKLAQSIAKAVDSDAAIIAQLGAKKEWAAQDREIARDFAKGPESVPQNYTASIKDLHLSVTLEDWSAIPRSAD
jgi:hypothetical protein